MNLHKKILEQLNQGIHKGSATTVVIMIVDRGVQKENTMLCPIPPP